MLGRWAVRVFRFAVIVTIPAGVAFLASRFWQSVPLPLHGAIFTGSAVLGALMSALAFAVMGKFDKLLSDSEKYDAAQVVRIYRYVGAVRRRLVLWVVSGVVCLLLASGAAYLVKEQHWADVRDVVVVGYFSLTVVLLAGTRVVSAYLKVDGFRLTLFRTIEAEEQRVQTLREMRKREVIGEFNDSAPAHVGRLSRAKQA